MPRRPAEVVYRFLLRAYPTEFRRAYGDEAVDVLFCRLHADAAYSRTSRPTRVTVYARPSGSPPLPQLRSL
jgi:hypothetical protein